jgi:hypothetical protein
MPTTPDPHNAPVMAARPVNTAATALALEFVAFTLAQEVHGSMFQLDDGQALVIANAQVWPTRVMPSMVMTGQDNWRINPHGSKSSKPGQYRLPFGQGFRRPFDRV